MRIESDIEIVPGRIYIYALLDPRDGDIRYIGKTNNPKVRYKAHLKGNKSASFVHWWRDIIKDGEHVVMYILFESSPESVHGDEIFTIQELFHDYGCELFNIVHGPCRATADRMQVIPSTPRVSIPVPVRPQWHVTPPVFAVPELTYTTFGVVGEQHLYNTVVLDYEYEYAMQPSDFYGA